MTKTAIQAQALTVGDVVISMAQGRLTVASVEAAAHGMLTVTATTGRTQTVSRTQLYFRLSF